MLVSSVTDRGFEPGQVKPKPIKFVFAASPQSIKNIQKRWHIEAATKKAKISFPTLLFLPFQWQSNVVDLVDPPLPHFYVVLYGYITTYTISAYHD